MESKKDDGHEKVRFVVVEVQHQRHRTRLVREVTHELDIPTSLTPAPNHLLRLYFVGCAKEVSNLINHPVMNLFGSRVIGTGANMIAESVDGNFFANTGRKRKFRQCRYCCTNTPDEECLSEVSRPGLISAMSPDLSQPTHGFIPEDPPRSVLFI